MTTTLYCCTSAEATHRSWAEETDLWVDTWGATAPGVWTVGQQRWRRWNISIRSAAAWGKCRVLVAWRRFPFFNCCLGNWGEGRRRICKSWILCVREPGREVRGGSLSPPPPVYFLDPEWIFLFMINRTSSTYLHRKWPISHCAAIFSICPLSHQSVRRFKRMQFKRNFLCTLWIRA